jgi:hypothetical protein
MSDHRATVADLALPTRQLKQPSRSVVEPAIRDAAP